MKTAILYLGIAAIGYFIGIRFGKILHRGSAIGIILAADVTVLIFIMGFRIGGNSEIVSQIKEIGLASLFMAIAGLVATIAGLFLLRKLLGYNRVAEKATLINEDKKETNEAERPPVLSKSTIRYLLALVTGYVLAYILVIKRGIVDEKMITDISGTVVTILLYILVFLVGEDMGNDGSFFTVFKTIGLRILLFPLVTGICTIVATLLCGLILPINVKESLAIACTFGWYSLGPTIIMDAGMISTGAYAFLTNFFRDMISLITIPVVASRIGYLETVGMPQAAAMDVCIGTFSSTTNQTTTMFAFASGAIFTAIIPILVPLLVSI